MKEGQRLCEKNVGSQISAREGESQWEEIPQITSMRAIQVYAFKSFDCRGIRSGINFSVASVAFL